MSKIGSGLVVIRLLRGCAKWVTALRADSEAIIRATCMIVHITSEEHHACMALKDPIRRVVVFGGTGFLGRRIVARLCDAGFEVRIAVHKPDGVPHGNGITATRCDVRDESSVAATLSGYDAAINAVGQYVEHSSETFEAVHESGARNVARAACALSLKHLVHISGIGVDRGSPSAYVRARAKGEELVLAAFSSAVVLRPSVMFAPDDRFVNALAKITRFAPVLPLFGSGATRLQPVCAGDVADAVLAVLSIQPPRSSVYELGGPEILTYRELIELLLEHTGRRRLLIPIPFSLWHIVARLCRPLPTPPVTKAQVTLMEADNVVASGMLGFVDLQITPKSLSTVLPQYRL